MSKKAFSLVEMLVVLAIIGLISAAASVSATAFRQKSRDTQRLADAKEVQAALELYRLNEGSYPTSIDFGQPFVGSSSTSTVYVSHLPNNPVVTNTAVCDSNNYSYSLDEKNRYQLQFCLERGDNGLAAGYYCARPSGLTPGNCSTILRASLVGGAYNEYLFGIAADTTSVYAVGRSYSDEALGDSFIAKLNKTDLSVTEKVYWGSTNNFESLSAVTTDASYLYAVGSTFSLSDNNDSILLVYDKTNLGAGPLRQISFSGSGGDHFFNIIQDDQYLYAIGYSTFNWYGGTDYDIILAKYRKSDFGLESQAYYQGWPYESPNSAIMSNGYIYTAGVSNREAAFIMKINPTTLAIVAQKKYDGGLGDDRFYGLTAAGSNIYAAGYTNSVGNGNYDGLIVKYDTDLNVVNAVTYGGTALDQFMSCTADASHLYAFGITQSESGNPDGLMTKFDLDLNLVASKYFTAEGSETLWAATNSAGYNYIAGYTESAGAGSYDGLIIKNIALPTGDYDTIPSGFQFKDNANCSANIASLTATDYEATTGSPNMTDGLTNFSSGISSASSSLYIINQ